MQDSAKSRRRFLPEPLRKVALAVGLLVVCEVGSRIVAPGLNGQALRDFLQAGASTWLLRVYDWFVGGALSRGGVLAIGIMPYLSARIMMRLARVTWPQLESWWRSESGIAKRTRLTRWITGGLALVQSYGFAKFVQNIPGVVAHPGVGFLAKTMAVLTAGTIGVMLISEALVKARSDHEFVTPDEKPSAAEEKLASEPVETASIDAAPPAALLSSGEVLDTSLYTRQRERVEARPLSEDDDRVRR
jgi:preprotein translocase subunit SecY